MKRNPFKILGRPYLLVPILIMACWLTTFLGAFALLIVPALLTGIALFKARKTAPTEPSNTPYTVGITVNMQVPCDVRHMTIPHRTTWRFGLYLLTAAQVLFFDTIYFGSFACRYDALERGQTLVASIVILLVGLRFVGARIFQEKNVGWVYYLGILIASPFLVRVTFAILDSCQGACLQ